ncbi:MAG: SAM-dependent chlorinase/fluorinase [Phycisphaerae bacterium]|nr:SAM-dependent chlorinase/fluorinase [Phycisphaerae bacterium]MDW8262019.1 SAM-dependent chlorinase/fluorinase [Phycisphaerales bacterium]
MAGVAPQSNPAGPPPIITFLSDFGLCDSYVAEMKAAALRACPTAVLVDVTHAIPQGDLLRATMVLGRTLDAFEPGTIHVAVVDPGVGTDRRLLIARIRGQFVVCPDNGLITWPWRQHGGEVLELTWRPARHSNTFHGRDILAPAAAQLAAGKEVTAIARPLDQPILLEYRPLERGQRLGQIVLIDHFGNAITNIPAEVAREQRVAGVAVAGRQLGPLRETYGSVARGQALALIGSSGLLEIAVRDGSAAQVLALRVGDPVELQEQGEP